MNPFSSLGTTTISGDNPFAQGFHPLLELLLVLVLGVLIWRLSVNYMAGKHSAVIREIVFGVVVLVFIVDPALLGPIVGWLQTHVTF